MHDLRFKTLFPAAIEAARATASAPEEHPPIAWSGGPGQELGLRLLHDRGVTSKAFQWTLRHGLAKKIYGMCILLAPEELSWERKMIYIETLEEHLERAGLWMCLWRDGASVLR